MDISIKVTYKSEGLQKLRKAAGLSQSQLADLAGIKVQVLQQYERGARDINGAKLPTLLKICNALECRLADIITDEETLVRALLEVNRRELHPCFGAEGEVLPAARYGRLGKGRVERVVAVEP